MPPLPWWRRLPLPRHRAGATDGIDAAIALASFAVCTPPILLGWVDGIGSRAAIALFGIAAVAPLPVRRRWPVGVVVVVAAVVAVASLAGVRWTPWVSNAGPALAVAVLTLADRCPRRVSIPVTCAAVVATAVAARTALDWYPDQDQNFVQLLIAPPAWLAGDILRTRRSYRRQLAEQARGREAEKERRVRAEERLRVSREVHDVLSHTLGMIAVRSGVARLLGDEQPDEARRALAAIETASRDGLAELRRVLRQLRDVPPEDHRETPPTLADVEGLVEGVRNTGLALDYRVCGPVAAYPAVLETSAYRIVQEALTNMVKHAHASRGSVEIRYTRDELTLSVLDDGRGAEHSDAGEPGLGLTGMRERVALFGGTLEAGTRREGGFAVVARIPATGAPESGAVDAE